MAVTDQLKRLEGAVNALIAEQQLLKKENAGLRQQLEELKSTLTARDQALHKAESDLKNARLARGLASSEEESQQAKAKIGSLMREIDRCMALLND